VVIGKQVQIVGHGFEQAADQPDLFGTGTEAPCSRKMKKILAQEFAAFVEPGALIAVALVLLTMAAGDAAMAIAARGWPF
jgi:hypothetical protein